MNANSRIFAIPADNPARPKNPKNPAISAKIKNVNAQPSILSSPSSFAKRTPLAKDGSGGK